MPLQGKYEVKLGRSFIEPPVNTFMSMRCDFLPASVDRNQPGTIKISNDKEVGLRLPNVSGAELSSTLFKGNIRPIAKECLLIYNKNTGELTLERISKAAQLKKTRDDPANRKLETNTQPAISSDQVCLSKCPIARTMSESSSDELNEPAISSVVQHNRQRQRPSPSLQQPAKHSTLSSSSDSDDDLDVPLRSDIRDNFSCGGGGGNNRPASPGNFSHSSLSSLEDDPKEVPKSQIKTQQNRSRLSPLTQRRALMENDLHLTDSDSEDNS